MAGGDAVDWLISLNEAYARRAAYAALLCGSLSVALFGYWMLQIPWQVSATSPTVAAEGAACGASGAVYFIRVNGSRYECGGGDDKCPTSASGPVAYDPALPSRCRLAKNVRRLSKGQRSIVLLGVLALPYGLAFLAWNAAWASRGATETPLPLTYRLSRALFLASIAGYAVFFLWAGLTGHG